MTEMLRKCQHEINCDVEKVKRKKKMYRHGAEIVSQLVANRAHRVSEQGTKSEALEIGNDDRAMLAIPWVIKTFTVTLEFDFSTFYVC